MSYDPQALFELMYGRPAHLPEPPEFAIFKKIEADFLSAMEPQGAAVVRQLTILSNKAGLTTYLQYAFFVLVERYRDWPTMPSKQRRAMVLGQTLMTYGGWTPNYSDGMLIPKSMETDKAVDQLLVELGDWCQKDMLWQITRVYLTILGKYAPAFGKLKPEVPSDMVRTALGVAFENYLRKAPGLFQRPDFVHGVVELIMP